MYISNSRLIRASLFCMSALSLDQSEPSMEAKEPFLVQLKAGLVIHSFIMSKCPFAPFAF